MNESPFSALLFPLHSTLLHSIPLRSILPHSTPLHFTLHSPLYYTLLHSTPLHSTQCFIPFHSTTPHHTTPHHSIPFQSTPLHSTSTQLSSSLASFSFGCNHRVQATTRYLDFSCSALPSLSLSLSVLFFAFFRPPLSYSPFFLPPPPPPAHTSSCTFFFRQLLSPLLHVSFILLSLRFRLYFSLFFFLIA